ncbi:3'-5' exonuclease [[Limnothrix rosea] IAM M-220]|uniref:3'-5' exonuclease n=1 Tax=[Limnothrix rosea] IAM M-220 TaxID=454133 RepID=UPI00111588BB|nr:3'-5' exonuclease [[Limnothrix rosea] IAM M-220]
MTDLLLIVDVETTGLDPKEDEVIELGAILYSVKEACTLQQFSTLFPVTQNPAENINKISPQASQQLDSQGITPFILLTKNWIDQADYLVAHNAQFDRQWFGRNFLVQVNKPWLCTYDDFV